MELTDQELEWAKDLIRKTGLFAVCSDDELQGLLNGLDKQRYPCGNTILMQGEISSRLCLIQSGKVAIIVRKGKDKNKVAELGPCAYFGEISLLMPRAAMATVKAEENTDIIFLPGEVVQEMVKRNSDLSEKLHCKIDERLTAQNKREEEKEHN